MYSPHLFLSSVEQFIRDKYERKLYISKDVPAVSPVTESKPEPAKGKSKKQSSSQKRDQVSVLHGYGVPRSHGTGLMRTP